VGITIVTLHQNKLALNDGDWLTKLKEIYSLFMTEKRLLHIVNFIVSSFSPFL